MKIWRGTARSGTLYEITGDPASHQDFRGWGGNGRKREAGVLIDREVIWFHLAVSGTQVTNRPCNTGCRRAKGQECRCSCAGKNHGIENRGLSETGEPLAVIYVGDY